MKIIKKKIPAKTYREIVRDVPLLYVDVIATNGKSFLMLKRENKPERHKWWFPGGRVLKNELLVDAAKRKLKEETGLRAIKLRPLGIYEYRSRTGYFPHINTDGLVTVFGAIVKKTGKIKMDEQNSAFKWCGSAQSNWHPYLKKFVALMRRRPLRGNFSFSTSGHKTVPVYFVSRY